MSDKVEIRGDVELTHVTKEERFIGMTKIQFLGLILALMFLLSVSTTYSIAYAVHENSARIRAAEVNASRLDEDHTALCTFKNNLSQRVDNSRHFLSLSFEERVAQYGEALGNIPPESVRSILSGDEQDLGALRTLQCN